MAIYDNITCIKERVHECCLRIGRRPEEVRLMAVSKFFPRSSVEAAWKAGITLFGESRVQEASLKFGGTPRETGGFGHALELHLIGGLQRNKAQKAAALFDCIQSVDRHSLIDTLGELTIDREKPLMLLLELNPGEAQKGGYQSEEELLSAVERISRYDTLCVRGLMTVAPFADPNAARLAFRKLAAAREKLARAFPGSDFSILSMGMSTDYTMAIEEGSTMLRIGTAIFGERGANGQM